MRLNPSYDVVNDILASSNLIKNQCDYSCIDPSTFLNSFLPLRMHPKTREAIDATLEKFRPENESIYYGLILS